MTAKELFILLFMALALMCLSSIATYLSKIEQLLTDIDATMLQCGCQKD